MSLLLRTMTEDDAAAVAAMVHGLAQHVGGRVVPRVTGEALWAARDLVAVVVAEEAGQLLGACLGLMTFSTWRGARGLYVVDLFVVPQARGRSIGVRLLRESARRAATRGARFIKLEVDVANPGAERFYARLGFGKKPDDRLHILEQEDLDRFIAAGDTT